MTYLFMTGSHRDLRIFRNSKISNTHASCHYTPRASGHLKPISCPNTLPSERIGSNRCSPLQQQPSASTYDDQDRRPEKHQRVELGHSRDDNLCSSFARSQTHTFPEKSSDSKPQSSETSRSFSASKPPSCVSVIGEPDDSENVTQAHPLPSSELTTLPDIASNLAVATFAAPADSNVSSSLLIEKPSRLPSEPRTSLSTDSHVYPATLASQKPFPLPSLPRSSPSTVLTSSVETDLPKSRRVPPSTKMRSKMPLLPHEPANLFKTNASKHSSSSTKANVARSSPLRRPSISSSQFQRSAQQNRYHKHAQLRSLLPKCVAWSDEPSSVPGNPRLPLRRAQYSRPNSRRHNHGIIYPGQAHGPTIIKPSPSRPQSTSVSTFSSKPKSPVHFLDPIITPSCEQKISILHLPPLELTPSRPVHLSTELPSPAEPPTSLYAPVKDKEMKADEISSFNSIISPNIKPTSLSDVTMNDSKDTEDASSVALNQPTLGVPNADSSDRSSSHECSQDSLLYSSHLPAAGIKSEETACVLPLSFETPPHCSQPKFSIAHVKDEPAEISLSDISQNGESSLSSDSKGADVQVKQEVIENPECIPYQRKLVTELCSFYPIPDNCRKPFPRYRENRFAFFKKEYRKLQNLGLRKQRVVFRCVLIDSWFSKCNSFLIGTTEWWLSGMLPWEILLFLIVFFVGLALFLFGQTPYFLRYLSWFQNHPCFTDIEADSPRYEA